MTQRRFIGGLRTFYGSNPRPRLWQAGLSASRPLAELLVDEESVLVRLRWGWLRRVANLTAVGQFEAPREAVRADRYGHSAMTRGVLLVSQDDKAAIFWCSKRRQREILETLRANT